MLAVLRRADFRQLWLAGLLSAAGTQISRIGLILHLFNERQSVPDLALLFILSTLPGAVAATVAGAVADRVHKGRLMILTDLARAAFMLVILLRPSLGVIYAMTALHSFAAAFFQPAKSSAIPRVVERHQLTAANSVDQGARNVISIVGPALGAEIFLSSGLAGVLAVDVFSYLASAALLARVQLGERRARPAGSLAATTVEDIRQGWRYLGGHELVRALVILFFVSLLCAGLWLPLAPFFIRDFLGASDRVLGIQTGVFGFGGVIGGLLVAPRLSHRLGKGRLLYFAVLMEGLTLALYSLVPDVYLSCVIFGFWGVVVACIAVPYYSLVQQVVPEDLQGRIFAVVKQGEDIALILSMGLAAGLQSAYSAASIFTGAGVAYALFVLLAAATRPGRALLRNA